MNNLELKKTDLEEQEHLTLERLKQLKPAKITKDLSPRPEANLVELFRWVKDNFAEKLPKASSVNTYIHNKIAIDGSFLKFCEEVGATVSCLYRDAVASWRTDSDCENFLVQGVFHIKVPRKLDFLHAALFHKGNQYEDEVSFFILVDDSQFHKYTEFRNEYEDWLSQRDRSSLEIYVVGGDSIPYEREHSWEDLFLPEDLKLQIRSSVEGWLSAKEFYQKAKVPWKRGVLLYGPPGNGKTSTIKTIISNYGFKPVTIQINSQISDDAITEAFTYAQEQDPGLLYIEDLDTLFDSGISLSHFLNLLDGVETKNGIFVIGTANDLSLIKESLTDRPSRFDRKWEVPLPDKQMVTKFLKKWFGDLIDDAKYDKISDLAVNLGFSYVYLKEMYFTSVFNALSESREKPNHADIDKAIEQLSKDKRAALEGHRSSSYMKVGI